MAASGSNPIEVGNGARPAAANYRELVTAETAEPGTRPSRNPRLTGTLPPAGGGVKRHPATPGVWDAGRDRPAPRPRLSEHLPTGRQAGSGMGKGEHPFVSPPPGCASSRVQTSRSGPRSGIRRLPPQFWGVGTHEQRAGIPHGRRGDSYNFMDVPHPIRARAALSSWRGHTLSR